MGIVPTSPLCASFLHCGAWVSLALESPQRSQGGLSAMVAGQPVFVGEKHGCGASGPGCVPCSGQDACV